MAACSEAEVNSLLVYKSPAWRGGVHLLICGSRKNPLLYQLILPGVRVALWMKGEEF